MSSLEDSFEYVLYVVGSPGPRGRPLIEKKSRLISAVVHNQVEILRELFDSPEWYNVRDRDGYTLLQIAILRENREAFDYMLSIPDFPIDYVNKNEQTALVVALDEYNYSDDVMDEYYAYELVRKGACINVVCFEGDSTPLHRALDRLYYRVAMFLVEKGVDVNVIDSHGYAPLYLALKRTDNANDIICALLFHGARPSMKIFECSLFLPAPSTVQEILFLYIYDPDRAMRISLAAVLTIAERRSIFFQEIINHPNLRIRSDTAHRALYYRSLCSMELDYLQIVIDRIGRCLSGTFAGVLYGDIIRMLEYGRRFCLENLNVLLGSDLKWEIISVISVVNSKLFEILMIRIQNEATITQIYCFLLSYGLNIRESDLLLVYWRFGYCELFKILLYMDIKASAGMLRYIRCLMPVFIYDVRMNLESFLADRTLRYFCSMEELFSHFAHPRLKAIYLETHGRGVPNRNNPDFPLLLELARNAFRQYFINRLQIKTSCQFHTELNRLPIPVPHKKMITYETKLY